MKILSFITTVFTFFYLFKNQQNPLILNMSNAFFIIGLIYLCIGFSISVRNLGFFKSLSYFKYKLQGKKSEDNLENNEFDNTNSNKKKDFYEYVNDKYSVQWSSAIFYIFSIPLLAISIILAFAYK